MTFKLDDVSEWTLGVHCVPTALCAISGRRPTEIAQLLSNIEKQFGADLPADPGRSFNIRYWLPTIEHLGGGWTQSEDFSDKKYHDRETPSEFINRIHSDDIFLVFGENEEGDMTHVFALSGNELVDTCTEGKRSLVRLMISPNAMTSSG